MLSLITVKIFKTYMNIDINNIKIIKFACRSGTSAELIKRAGSVVGVELDPAGAGGAGHIPGAEEDCGLVPFITIIITIITTAILTDF